MTRDEQIDLVYDVIRGIGSIDDKNNEFILTDYISREDIARELDKVHAQKVKEIAERYAVTLSGGTFTVSDQTLAPEPDAQLIELARRESEAGQRLRETIIMLGGSQLRK